jgi:hypothetical protein
LVDSEVDVPAVTVEECTDVFEEGGNYFGDGVLLEML